MRIADRALQTWRAWKARPWVTPGARVLDMGCHQGELLRGLGHRIGPSIGLDPLARPEAGPRFRILAEPFRERACAADPPLRQRIEALLRSDAEAGGFLESSGVEAEATGDVVPGRWMDPAEASRLAEGPSHRLV